MRWFGGDETGEQPIMTEVVVEPFSHDVLDQGEVESSNNVEVKCLVKSRNSGGTEIIWVIDEGEVVEKDQVVLRLDSSALEEERDRQQIVCNTSLGIKVQAKNNYEAALIEKTEYLEGAFKQEERTIQSEIFVAEENQRRAEQYARYSERLAAKGYVTALQLEADRFAVKKARNELELARQKLLVLQKFTKEKNLKNLESAIATAKTKWETEEKSYILELKQLDEIVAAIKDCTLTSPKAGQVVYANVYSSRGNSEFVVEAGAKAREGQTLIRIPDPTSMQAKALINESRVTLVKPGMKATLQFDSYGDQEFPGVVTHVNQYAEPSSWSRGNVKEYATYIKIIDPPKGMRPGLSSAVRIHVEYRPEAMQLPVQAMCEQQGEFFVLVQNGDSWKTVPVKVGSSNDKTVTIEEGDLAAGDKVALNPRRYDRYLELPEATEDEPMEVSEENVNRALNQANDKRSADKTGSPSDKKGQRPPGATQGGAAKSGATKKGGPRGPN